MRSALSVALLALAASPLFAASPPLPPLPPSPAYEVWHIGSPDDFVPAPSPKGLPTAVPRPGLLLMGGGGDVDDAWRWFVACAAGGDLIVLRAGGGDGYQKFLYETIGGLASVTTIKFNDATAATDPALLARLASAEAIFMAGGDQAKYITYWKDTPVAAALNAHLAAGKPLGGTSAGLAVLGEHYFSALLDTITTEEALKNPFDEKLTLGTGFIAAPALAGVITDSHFMERERLGRLVAFLARLQADHPAAPRLVGLGIDEATALCIEPDAIARVHTAKSGSAWLVQLLASPAATAAPGQPLVARASVIGLGPDSTLDLRTLEVTAPHTARTVPFAK